MNNRSKEAPTTMTPNPRLKQQFPTFSRTLMSLSGKVKTRTPAPTIRACMRGNARLGRLLAALPTVGAFRRRGAVAMACLQRFQLISLSALLFAALALVTPSDKAFGQTTSIDLDILNVFYDPGSKDLIIVFNEGIDPDSVELSRFSFPRTITIPVQPLTSFEHDVNGNTLTVSLSSAVSDRLDEAIDDSAITIPTLVSDADAVKATDDRGGEPLEFSGFAGDALTILAAGAVPPPVVDPNIDLVSTSQPRTLTVSGNGITGQSIELFDRGTSAGTATVDNNGFWEIIVELARTTDFVTHTFTATATDSDSNTSARSNSESLGVDGEMNRSPTVNTGFGDGGLDLLLRLDSSSITLDLSNLYADPDGDPLTITFDNLNSGLITTNGSRITFRSATQADFPLNGMITFAVIVSDGLAHLLNDAGGNQLPFTVQINPDTTAPVLSASNVDQTLFDALIVATNPPTTTGLTATLAENTPHTFAAIQFNFADEDGDALHSLRIDTLPTTGSLALSGAAVTAMQVIPAADIPNLVYTPATDATGTVTFTYSLSDGTDFSEPPATATLTITGASVPAPSPAPAPAPDPVFPPDDDPLQLFNAEGLLIEDLTVVVSETKELAIEGGSLPFFTRNDFSGTAQSMIVSGSTLRVTGATAGQVSLRIRDIRGAFTFLPVRVKALPPVLNPEADDGTGTEAVFRGGASSDGGDSYSRDSSFSVSEALDVLFTITPRSVDVGERANVVIMARVASAPEVVWLLTPSGTVDPDGDTLAPYIENLALEANNFVDLTPDPITLTMAEVGNWELFIGYQLVGGELFYHPEEPLKIEVVELEHVWVPIPIDEQ